MRFTISHDPGGGLNRRRRGSIYRLLVLGVLVALVLMTGASGVTGLRALDPGTGMASPQYGTAELAAASAHNAANPTLGNAGVSSDPKSGGDTNPAPRSGGGGSSTGDNPPTSGPSVQSTATHGPSRQPGKVPETTPTPTIGSAPISGGVANVAPQVPFACGAGASKTAEAPTFDHG